MTFETLDRIAVAAEDGAAREIVLARGDLARIAPADDVDLLVISALPGDYTETPTSLVGQLARQGVSVRRLAATKARDLRGSAGVWISHPVPEAGFGRLVCFEPERLGPPPAVVGRLFRGLFRFLEDETEVSVAMPLVASGDAGWPAEAMLPPLLDAARGWLRLGLPIRRLTVVVRPGEKEDRAREIFAARRAAAGARPPPAAAPPRPHPVTRTPFRPVPPAGAEPPGDPLGAPPARGTPTAPRPEAPEDADDLFGEPPRGAASGDAVAPPPAFSVFLSFSSVDAAAADLVAEGLRDRLAGAEVFDFRHDIEIGASYQSEIDAALRDSDKVVVILSPDYMASPHCVEELMVARLRNKREGFGLLHPVYWRRIAEGLEDWLMILNLSDCVEADAAKLHVSVGRLAAGATG